MPLLNLNQSVTEAPEPIAIVGIGCRYPGISDVRSFWQVVANGVETVGTYPGGRLPELDRFYELDPTENGPPTRRGGFLPDIDKFDADFFGISPREAVYLDPQQRMLLEVGYEALEDAGQIRRKIAGTKSGVFMGIWSNDYQVCVNSTLKEQEFYTLTGGSSFGAASRLAYFFDLQGPEFVVNAGCASSLIAVYLACKSLRAGDCSMALAGGANIVLRKEATLAFKGANALSSDGRCKFGDARADGFVRSEGAGVVVLKRLSQAELDGDRIHALILGAAINSDGHSDGFWVSPSQAGQQRAIQEALGEARISAAQIQYVEAHGTGTRAGDPAELNALAAVIGRAPERSQPCAAGSIKTNIGHTESAAGVAGLIKAALAIKHRFIPPTLNVQQLTSAFDWSAGGIYLPTHGESWTSDGGRRCALVSSFGLTGSNSYAVISDAPQLRRTEESISRPAFLLPISAGSAQSLNKASRLFAEHLSEEKTDLANICYTAATRRNHLASRQAVVGRNARELASRLLAQIEQNPADSSSNSEEPGGPPQVVFVFPGQGSQWHGMGQELYRDEPAFRTVIDDCDPLIQQEAGWSLVQQINDNLQASRLELIDVVQPTLFAIEIALAALWRSWGIQPDAVVGHSMGEVAAAFVAQILSLPDAVRIICRRSRLLLRMRGRGAMALIEATIPEAERAISGFEDRLSIAVSNSTRSTVISGDPTAIDQVLASLEASGVFCRRVKVDVASHSPQMDVLTDDLLASLEGIAPHPAAVPFFSTVEGRPIDGTLCDPGYWVRNLRKPVLFSKAIESLIEEGVRAFVEVSPHPLLIPSIEQSFSDAGQRGLAVGSLRREEGELEMLYVGAGELFKSGVDLAWERIYPIGSHVDLPHYVWNRKRFWIESEPYSQGMRFSTGGHPLIGEGTRTADGRWSWITQIGFDSSPWIEDHAVRGAVLLPASAYIEMAQAAGRVIFGGAAFSVEALSLIEALMFTLGEKADIQLLAAPDNNTLFTLRFLRRLGDDSMDWGLFASAAIRTDVTTEFAGRTFPLRQAGTQITGGEHNAFMRSYGYDFGPNFQGVTVYRAFERAAEGEVRLPEGIPTRGYGIHPALLDSALQFLCSLLLRERKLSTQILPVEIGRIRQYVERIKADTLYVQATVADDLSQLSGEVLVSDDAGNILLSVEDLVFRVAENAPVEISDELLYSLHWKQLPMPERAANTGGTYLVCASEDHPVVEGLRKHGAQVIVSDRDTIGGISIESPLKGIVLLWNDEPKRHSDFEVAVAVCSDTLDLVKKLEPSLRDARVWLVTRNAMAVSPADSVNPWQSPLWGLAAVLDKERPELRATCIDVDLNASTTASIVEEVLGDSKEQRVAWRNNARFVQRLRQDQGESEAEHSRSQNVRFLRPEERFELFIRTKGTLDSFELRAEERRIVGPDEVEIEVAATALNFIDVATAMGLGQITRSALGLECAGTVTRIGSNVNTVTVGDKVIGVSPSYQSVSLACSHAVVPAELIWKKPDSLTMEEAASIPSVFMTAYYALVRLAHLSAGESVLIHSGSGGVGLAAIQIAKWLGAEVYATAGSESKRSFLRELGIEHVMDSRTLQFGAEVRTQTKNRGVDVILNSLTGPAISEGLRSLAPYGRFVEIGKLDIWQNTEIGLRPFLHNLSLSVLDLGSFYEERRPTLNALMREILSLFENGTLRPLPVSVYPVSTASEAFHLMASAKHIGKVVLDMKDSSAEVRTETVPVSSVGTYLITGGLGALGLLAAEELVTLGAKHLVLLGRNAPQITAEHPVSKLRSSDITVHVMTCDLSKQSDVEAVLDHIRQEMPPLRGIVHSAGILDDAVVDNMDAARFRTVMAGKAYGAHLLDHLTADLPLDFFILFSSVACVLGSAGQSNYAAANAYLDGLAADRVRRGRPATSINWGPWAEIGLAAAQSNRGDRLLSHGLYSLKPNEGRQLFRTICKNPRSQVLAMRFDAEQWRQAYGSAGDNLFLEELRSVESTVQSHAPTRVIDQIRSAEPKAAAAILLEHVATQVAAVLRLDQASVPVKKPFRTLGLDSLLGLELRNRLERTLGLRLSATVVWNYPTIENLSNHLLERIEIRPSADEPVTASTPSSSSNRSENTGAATASAADLLDAELREAEALLQSS